MEDLKKGEFDEKVFKTFSEHKYDGYGEIKRIFTNALETIVIMTLFTMLSLIFRKIGFHESNVIIVFILGEIGRAHV